jgi:K+-transporting ATPase KdpF subunit
MMKMSVILGVCALIGAALLVYLFYVLFRGEKL